MFEAVSNFISGGGGDGGGSSGGDLLGTLAAGLFNQKSSREQMRFQQAMSSSAYRRAAADLDAAGLNRILAFGNPASTPSGAKATMEAPKLGSTGIAAATAKQTIAQSKAKEKLDEATTKLIQQQTRSANAQADKDEVTKAAYEVVRPYLDDIVNADISTAKEVSGKQLNAKHDIGVKIGDHVYQHVRRSGKKTKGGKRSGRK